ncbi:hypothetical protein BDA99DRAFT_591565 [Phascolomyces articulosus]|uniref:Uncharacterized protein n=1 Tax=Phascolomyces articulosus TaxID=60185 RepID=A0AAD5JYF5_9FUNG|nr:hypothetical protein BDA99DRAFT_591565 [Phascolomyces articulosus]
MIQVAIIPTDHTSNIYSFLRPLINELRVLKDGGMRVNCGNSSIHVKVHCLLASGDIISVQELIHHKGCMSLYSCQQCRIQSVCEISPAGRGYSRYYTGTIRMSAARTDDEFRGEVNEFGIDKANDFAQLKSFHGYSFFGLDKLHLIGTNVMKKLWQMISGDFDTVVNTTIQLPNRACSAIGNAIVTSSATLPSGIFKGSFRDVLRKAGLMRSVDWIVFLQLVIPTLVFEQLVEEYTYSASQVNALMSLVIGCTLALQWHIDATDLNNIKSICPLRGFSTCSAEWAIGFFKKHIKQRVLPGANAANIIKRRLITSMYNCAYPEDFDLDEEQPKQNQYTIPGGNKDLELWDWHESTVDKYFTEFNLLHYLKKYWHNQFKDNRVLNSTLDCNIRVGERFFRDDTVYRCNKYPGTASKLSTLVKLQLPIKGSGTAFYFGELILFFTHTYAGRQLKKGVPYGHRTDANTSESDKLCMTASQNILGHVGLLKSSLHTNRYYVVYPDMIPGDITLGKISDV